jgi:site-specific recombinase XerC
MSTHDLAPFLTAFFLRHLPTERNASPHTVAAYRDSVKLLLRFMVETTHRSASTLQVEDLTPDRILQFLDGARNHTAQFDPHAQRASCGHPCLLPLRAR